MIAFTAQGHNHLRLKDSLKNIFGYQCYTYTNPKSKAKGKIRDSCNRQTAAGSHIMTLLMLICFPDARRKKLVEAAFQDNRYLISVSENNKK